MSLPIKRTPCKGVTWKYHALLHLINHHTTHGFSTNGHWSKLTLRNVASGSTDTHNPTLHLNAMPRSIQERGWILNYRDNWQQTLPWVYHSCLRESGSKDKSGANRIFFPFFVIFRSSMTIKTVRESIFKGVSLSLISNVMSCQIRSSCCIIYEISTLIIFSSYIRYSTFNSTFNHYLFQLF